MIKLFSILGVLDNPVYRFYNIDVVEFQGIGTVQFWKVSLLIRIIAYYPILFYKILKFDMSTPSVKSTQYISYSGIIANLAELSMVFIVLLVMSDGRNLSCTAKILRITTYYWIETIGVQKKITYIAQHLQQFTDSCFWKIILCRERISLILGPWNKLSLAFQRYSVSIWFNSRSLCTVRNYIKAWTFLRMSAVASVSGPEILARKSCGWKDCTAAVDFCLPCAWGLWGASKGWKSWSGGGSTDSCIESGVLALMSAFKNRKLI